MEKRFDPRTNKAKHMSPLSWLIFNKGKSLQPEAVKQLISKEKSSNDEFDINEKGGFTCFTALHWAVSVSTIEIVQILVNFGADVNAKDALGFTPLFFCAIDRFDLEMVRFLVEKCKAKPDEANKFDSTCLHGPAKQGSLKVTTNFSWYLVNLKTTIVTTTATKIT